MKYYKLALSKYADFRGRSRRSEYWYFVLFNAIFAWVAMLIDSKLIGFVYGPTIPYGVVYTIYGLFTFIPSIAVSVRRLHDVNKSGWYLLLLFLPIIGWIWLLVLDVTDSYAGENKWGSNPKSDGVKFEFEEKAN